MNQHGTPTSALKRPSFTRMDPARRPVIVANPPGDRRFVGMIDAGILSGVARPEELEAILRTRYPKAIVRPRDLDGERAAVWYVYREGHWIRSDEDAHS